MCVCEETEGKEREIYAHQERDENEAERAGTKAMIWQCQREKRPLKIKFHERMKDWSEK